MDTIPFEIRSEIFGQLAMSDWLQCIQVCRSWRSIVPMVVGHIAISLDESNWHCISQIYHFYTIRSVILHRLPAKCMCVVLDRLSACRITQLDINQVRFKSLGAILSQYPWTNQLESLALTKPLDIELEINFLDDIIAICPKLTNFSFIDHPRNSRLKISAPTMRSSLVSLSLSTYLEYSQVVGLLLSSPNLQMLKLSFVQPIDPQMILSFCPSITYLHLGSFDLLPGFEWKDRQGDDKLRYLCLSTISCSTSAFLSEHAATLQVLHLPTSLPVSFQSRRLKVLSCDGSQDGHGIIDNLLEGLPNIQELYLDHIVPTPSLSRAIRRLAPTLLTLKITTQFESDDLVLLETLGSFPNLTSLAYQCHAINSSKLRALANIKSLHTLLVKSIDYAPFVSLNVLEELNALQRLELWRMAYFSVEPLKHLECLESIQLHWCMAPVGIRLLVEKAPQNLKKIKLVKCRVSAYEDIPERILVNKGINIVVQ